MRTKLHPRHLRLALLVLLLLGAAHTALAIDFMVDGIYYTKNGSEATEISVKTHGKINGVDVVIQGTVTNTDTTCTFSTIGDETPQNSYALTSKAFPNSIITIEFIVLDL